MKKISKLWPALLILVMAAALVMCEEKIDGFNQNNSYHVTFDSHFPVPNAEDNGWKNANPTVIRKIPEGKSIADTGEDMPFPPRDPDKYWKVVGWKDDKDNSFDKDTPVTNDITVYAQWEEATWSYTVTFNGSGGVPEIQTRTVTYPDTTVSDLPSATRADHRFNGWMLNGIPFGTGTAVSGDITVYAQWTANSGAAYSYTVTFDGAGGGGHYPQSITVNSPRNTIGQSGGMPSNPVRSGYDFDGWSVLQTAQSPFTRDTPVSGDITVYAWWKPASYTVTFSPAGGNWDGDTAAQYRTVTFPNTTVSDIPPDPKRADWTFTGWMYNGAPFHAGTAVSGDAMVTAQWTPHEGVTWSYLVTFNPHGGDWDGHIMPQAITVKSPATTVGGDMPQDPIRDGYVFDGWSSVPAYKSPFNGDTPVSADIDLYAWWVPRSYTVTFNANGGTPETQTIQVNNGEKAASLPNTTQTGYTLTGWNTQEDGSGTAFTADTIVTADITVYAQWTANPVVTFNGNGGEPETQTRTAQALGASLGQLPMVSRDNHIFGGWFQNADGTGLAFTGSILVYGDITVYAKWTPIYTVTFNGNGGTPETQTRTVNEGEKAASLPNVIQTGYAFEGWNTQTDGGGTAFTADTAVTANITVYAQWTANPVITFNGNGGEPETQTRTVTAPGASVGQLPAVSRNNHVFGGWFQSADGSGQAFTGSTPVYSDIIVYARWTPVYTVTFNSNGGSAVNPSTITVTFPATSTGSLPPNPVMAGFGFAGWYTEQVNGTPFTAATTVSSDITVYAHWNELTTWTKTQGPIILAHYMPWNQGPAYYDQNGGYAHWSFSDGELIPLTDRYNGGSKHLLQYQLAVMKLAGIDGVLICWYGSVGVADFGTNQGIAWEVVNMIDESKSKFAICLEDWIIDHGSWPDANINWLKQNWFDRSYYVKTPDNRPLLLCFGPQRKWMWDGEAILSGINPRPYFVELVQCLNNDGSMNPGFDFRVSWSDSAYNWFGLHNDRRVYSSQEIATFLDNFYNLPKYADSSFKVGTIFSAFVDTYEWPGIRYGRIEYDNGAIFNLTWDKAMANDPDVIQIATWNDYGEGTAIEPTRQRGYNELEFLQARMREMDPTFPYTAEDLRYPLEFYRLIYYRGASGAQQNAINAAYNALWNGDVAEFRVKCAETGVSVSLTDLRPISR